MTPNTGVSKDKSTIKAMTLPDTKRSWMLFRGTSGPQGQIHNQRRDIGKHETVMTKVLPEYVRKEVDDAKQDLKTLLTCTKQIDSRGRAIAVHESIMTVFQKDVKKEIDKLREQLKDVQARIVKPLEAKKQSSLQERLVSLLKERGGLSAGKQHQLAGMFPEALWREEPANHQ
jgi:hypothetical protein